MRRGFNLRDEDRPVELDEQVVFNVQAIDPSLEKIPACLPAPTVDSE